MAKFISRGSENKSLVEAARKVTQACDTLPDGADKEAMMQIVLPITALVAIAVAGGLEADQADDAWKRVQRDRDARDASADAAVRHVHAKLVAWAGGSRTHAMVRRIFTRGIGFYVNADDDQPELMALLLEWIAKATHAELTAERKAELESITRPVIKPLADARDAARMAWVRRKLVFARYDNDVDDVWVAARKAYGLALLQLPAALVETVFASLLVEGTAPAAPDTASTADAPTT